ncbi:MAG TPA: O-acetylhomoserine aminocarboxypropyltransferase/cysteine synthase [Candidatus Avamphibacillus intestinigallinarum]|nr:O-acetylhomoserine aminocarboxypropyltransferase/cysteine synthase [Candidatus Avamphibacillus intestinigallinarum]
MSQFDFHSSETNLLHAGQSVDPTTGSRAVPIYQTTSYVFKDTEHAQNLFGLAEPGNIYTRIMNPTVDAFEQRMATLEDGTAAVALSSGMAAITLSIMNIAQAGDEIIADSNLYGGTYNLFVHTLPKYGIDVKFVDGTDLDAIENAITDKTKAIFGEVITNPSLNVFDIEAVADVAHKHGVPLIIDNTFATPYAAKPFQWGADIVVHSATKWIGGHGTTIGGIVIDSGRFDWTNGRFPGFTEPDESYGGLKYADLGPVAFAMKLRVQLLRDIGACISPHNAFLLLQGLETLHLRIQRHNENAEVVAAYLEKHPAVEWVNFPGLASHPSHQLAKKYFKSGYGSIITFGIKGGREAGRTLIDNIGLWSHVANVGDAKSLIIHPASTTHQQLDDEGLQKSGVTEELVRLAIGLESTDDTLRELDKAISIATGVERQLKDDEAHIKEWLLSSPFDRADGGLRQKTIVVIGSEQVQDQVTGLKKAGFDVHEYDLASKAPENTDCVWFADREIASCAIDKIKDKVKVIWGTGDAASNAREAGIAVIEEGTPFETFKTLRNARA